VLAVSLFLLSLLALFLAGCRWVKQLVDEAFERGSNLEDGYRRICADPHGLASELQDEAKGRAA
jgi:hypothetical protein